MNLQPEISLSFSGRSENWVSRKKSHAIENVRPLASKPMRALKPAVSIALLLAVAYLVGYSYGTSQIIADLRALSIGTACTFFLALFANAFAAVLRFKIISGEI